MEQANFHFYCKKPIRAHVIRLFWENQCENVQIALEDITAALLGTTSEDEETVTFVTDKIKQSEIAPILHEELHLVDVNDLEIFYLESDEIGADGVYESFGEWWLKLKYVINNKIAHLGELVIQLSEWDEWQKKTREFFGESVHKPITINQWVTEFFKLPVSWTASTLTTKIRILTSSTFRANVNRPPDKNVNANVYPPLTLVAAIPTAKEILENPRQFVQDVRQNLVIKKRVSTDIEQVQELKKSRIATEKIIEKIWSVTPQSHMTELIDGEIRNYQYDILVAFVNSIKV